jgi:hypothetical protein
LPLAMQGVWSLSSFAVIKPVDFRRNQASGRFSFSA